MSVELTHARVVDALGRLRLGHVALRLDALLAEAARSQPAYLDFLAQVVDEEVAAKQRKRVAMGIQIAHFPAVKTLEEFDFRFQPAIDQKLVRELATGRFIASADNVLIFGPPASARPIWPSPSAAPRWKPGIRPCSCLRRRCWPDWPRPRARGSWPTR